MVYLQFFRRGASHPFALVGAMLLMSFSQAAQAQTNTGIQSDPMETSGRNVIQGAVYFPDGRRPDHRLRVTLRGVNVPEKFTLTNDSGEFVFSGLRGGNYIVTVAAEAGYESPNEAVDLLESTGGHKDDAPAQTVTLRIELQAKPSAPQAIGTVAIISESARALYKQAVSASGGGDHKQAIELLNCAVAVCPDFWTAWNELGVQHLRLKQPAQALDALRNATKIEPDAFEPRLNTGIALLQMKDYAHAVAAFQQALETKKDSATAHLHLGHALVALNRFSEAELELKEAIRLGSDTVIEAHRFLGAVYIEQHQEPRAIAELEKYLTLAPAAPDAGRIRDIVKQLRNPMDKN